MPRSKKPRRARLLLIVAVVVAVALVATCGYLGVRTVRSSFPQTAGQLHLSGLSGPVDVVRDSDGIPQIYADSPEDLFMAQGYVQAQDRFWQMDVDRHITSGTLSEMFGSRQVQTDALVRTMDWRGVAQQEYDKELSPSTRKYLQAFTAGVNAWLGGHPGGAGASLEYAMLGTVVGGYTPAKWDPVDSVAWLKALSWEMSDTMTQQVEKALLSQDLTRAQIAQLFPSSTAGAAAPVVSGGAVTGGAFDPQASGGSGSGGDSSGSSGSGTGSSGGAVSGGTTGGGAASAVTQDLSASLTDLPELLGAPGSGVGANAWAVSGAHSVTGKPLLANDPHTGAELPSSWYQMGLHCNAVSAACPFDDSGFTVPGMPGVLVGHNQSVSWGMSGLGADDQDLYLEDLTGPDSYLSADGTSKKFTTRQETIKVAGHSPVTITVRVTDDGPLISDHSTEFQAVGEYAPTPSTNAPDRRSGYAVALKWSALTPSDSMDAVFGLDKATDFTQFRAAAHQLTSPSLGLVYADTAGNIGYQATGEVPERSSAATAMAGYPLPGWSADYAWGSSIPQDELPWTENPKSGYVVSADQAVVSPSSGYPYLLNQQSGNGARAARITSSITSKLADSGKISTDDMQKIQLDDTSPMASTLVPYLTRVDLSKYLSATDAAYVKQAQDLLKAWNYQQDAESSAAAYYNAVWRNLLKLAFGDKFPQTLQAKGSCRTVDASSNAVLPGDDLNGKPQQVKVCGQMEPGQAQPDGGENWEAVVSGLLTQPNSSWWNYSSKSGTTTSRDQLLAEAMRDARYELTSLMGKSVAGWQWGKVHELRLDDTMMGSNVPSWLSGAFDKLIDRGPFQIPGGSSSVDATGWDAASGYQVDWVPTMRMVVDLSDLDASRWITIGGASGHAFDAHYDDQTQKWADGEYLTWAYSQKAVKATQRDELALTPNG